MTTYPPAKTDISTGAWNTDIELDTTVYLSGDASLKIVSGHSLAVEVHRQVEPTSPGDVWAIEAVIRQGNITAGNHQAVAIYWLDKDLAYVDANVVFDSELPAINTWYTISGSGTCPAGATYAMPVWIRAAVGFDAWNDVLAIRRVQPSFWAYRNGSQTTSGAPDQVELDTETYDYGSMFDTGTYLFTAPSSGLYSITALVTGVNIADTKGVQAYLKLNDSSTMTYGSSAWNGHGSAASCSSVVSIGAISLSRGDTVGLWVVVDSGSTIAGGSYNTYMTATKL
jgi:hypothetical protein